jgi:hypothetical protein
MNYGPPPGYGNSSQPPIAPAENRFTPPSGPQDLWAAILFIVHLLAFCALAAVTINGVDFTTFRRKDAPPPNNGSTGIPSNSTFTFESHNITGLVCGGAAGILFSVLYLFAMRRFPRQIITGTFYLSIALSVLFMIVLFMTGCVALCLRLFFFNLYV